MEADSRLNNDAMKGEGTVRFIQMTAVRRMYMCTYTLSQAVYSISSTNTIYTVQSDSKTDLSIEMIRMHERVQVLNYEI